MAFFRSNNKNKQQMPMTGAEVMDIAMSELKDNRFKLCQAYTELASIDFEWLSMEDDLMRASVRSRVNGETVVRFGDEILNNIKVQVRSVQNYILGQGASDFDEKETELIDRCIYYFSKQLKSSLNNAYLYSVQACSMGLYYATLYCLAPIAPELDKSERYALFVSRESSLERFKGLVEIAEAIDKVIAQNKTAMKRYNERLVPIYDNIHNDFLTDKLANPDVYEDIRSMPGSELDDTHRKAWNLVRLDNEFFKLGEKIASGMLELDNTLSKFGYVLAQLEGIMTSTEHVTGDMTKKKIDDAVNDAPNKVRSIAEQAARIQADINDDIALFESAAASL